MYLNLSRDISHDNVKKLTLLHKVEYCMVQFLQGVPHMRTYELDFGHL